MATLITIDGIMLPIVTLAHVTRSKAGYRARMRDHYGPGVGFTVGGCTPCILRVDEPAPVGYTVTRVEQYHRHHLGHIRERLFIGYVPKGRPVWVARVAGGQFVAQSEISVEQALRNVRAKMTRAEV